MALTVTPDVVGLRGLQLTKHIPEDPTYVEVKRSDKLVVIILNNNGALNGSARSFNFESFEEDYDKTLHQVSTPTFDIDVDASYSIPIYPYRSKHLLDRTSNPYKLKLFGSELPDLRLRAYKLDTV